MPANKKQLFPMATLIALAILAIFFILQGQPQWHPPEIELKPGDYLFCFWNVENFFDDKDDPRNPIDDPYDDWFAEDKEALQLKLDRLTEVLLAMKGSLGPGPDIIALAEVETKRAAELLKKALNSQINDEEQHYKHILFKEVRVGRHMAPAIITRLPVIADKTKLLDNRQRTLEGHIMPKDGAQLVVIASHWTSRVGNGEEGRQKYADGIYGRFKAIYLQNPNIDLLVCGDFNDTPADPSVTEHLKAVDNLDLVRAPGDGEPYLFNLMAGKDPQEYGTLYYSGWLIFDQIAISPGLLDQQGWSCDPNSVRTIRMLTAADGRVIDLRDPKGKIGRPWRFGNRTDDPKHRGYSDHFPITAVLTLHGKKQVASR